MQLLVAIHKIEALMQINSSNQSLPFSILETYFLALQGNKKSSPFFSYHALILKYPAFRVIH